MLTGTKTVWEDITNDDKPDLVTRTDINGSQIKQSTAKA